MRELNTKEKSNQLCSGIRDGYALLELARGWLKQGNSLVAGELLGSAIVSAEAEADSELRAQVLKETGRAQMMQSEWRGAESNYLEAQRVFVGISNLKGASECARNRANMQFQQGNYQLAEELCEKALDWASEINDHELRATILNTLGAIKTTYGDFQEAIKTFKLCLSDFRSSGNLIRQGYVLLNIGLSLTELEQYDEAVSSLNESLSIALEEKDLSLVEICYQNISKCYLEMNETQLAKSVIDTARKILPGLNSAALESELNLIDCRILREMGDLFGAEQLLDRTYAMASEHSLTAVCADVLLEQGKNAKAKGDSRIAVTKFKAAADQYRHLGVRTGYECALDEIASAASELETTKEFSLA